MKHVESGFFVSGAHEIWSVVDLGLEEEFAFLVADLISCLGRSAIQEGYLRATDVAGIHVRGAQVSPGAFIRDVDLANTSARGTLLFRIVIITLQERGLTLRFVQAHSTFLLHQFFGAHAHELIRFHIFNLWGLLTPLLLQAHFFFDKELFLGPLKIHARSHSQFLIVPHGWIWSFDPWWKCALLHFFVRLIQFNFGCFLLHVALPLFLGLDEPLLTLTVGLPELFLVFFIVFVLHSVPTIFINFKIIGFGSLDTIFWSLSRHDFMI